MSNEHEPAVTVTDAEIVTPTSSPEVAATDAAQTTEAASSAPATAADVPAAAAPVAAAAAEETIELNTDTAQHVPHMPTPTLNESTAAAAGASSEDDDEEDEFSDPVSEAEVAEQQAAAAMHDAHMREFLDEIHGQAAAAAAAQPLSSDEQSEAFNTDVESSSSSAKPMASIDPMVDAAIRQIQEQLNASRSGAAASSSTDAEAAAAERRRQTAERKAAFRAAVAARTGRNADEEDEEHDDEKDNEEEDEEDDENTVAFETAAAARSGMRSASTPFNNAMASTLDEEEEDAVAEEEDEEEEEDASFVGFLRSKAQSLVRGKAARSITSGSKWLAASALSYAGKGLYVAMTLGVLALPLVIASTNESTNHSRFHRLVHADGVPEEMKAHIWLGAPKPAASAAGAPGMEVALAPAQL